tara:strand:+ start:359 stop:652 length:294 start_codon:yes stop_codon:yes gene_type:complete
MKSRESKVLTVLSEAEDLASKGADCLHTPPECCECAHDHPGAVIAHCDGEKRTEENVGCHCVRKGGKCARYDCLNCLRLDKTDFCAVMVRLQMAEGL